MVQGPHLDEAANGRWNEEKTWHLHPTFVTEFDKRALMVTRMNLKYGHI